MPDILKPRSIIETGDTVLIPDVDEPLYPAEPEEESADSESEALEDESEETTEEDTGGPDAASGLEEEPPEPEPPALTREDLAEMFREELEELYQSEAQRGYAEAMQQVKGELRECVARVDRQLAQMEELQTQFMTQAADELKFLAIDIAEKMICVRIEENDQTLNKLVMQTVSGIKNTNWLDVEVSEQLVGLVETLKRELEKPEYHGRATVTASACSPDTVRISSEEGTLVASVCAQAENLRDIFRKN